MKNQLIVKVENNSELAAEWVLLYTSLVIRILLKKMQDPVCYFAGMKRNFACHRCSS